MDVALWSDCAFTGASSHIGETGLIEVSQVSPVQRDGVVVEMKLIYFKVKCYL